MTVLVYKYGVPTRAWDGSFIEVPNADKTGTRRVRNMPWVKIPHEVKSQLWLGHRLRESFVDVESQFEINCEQAWCEQVPEIKEAVAQLADIADRIDVLITQARQEKLKNRSTTAAPETIAALKEQYKLESEQRRIIKAAKAIKANRTAVTPGLKASDDIRKQTQKDLYAKYCTNGIYPKYCNFCPAGDATIGSDGVCKECGLSYDPQRLYWATYNKILAQHKTAAQRIRAMWKEGKLARFKHHRYDGTGRIAVQLQREHGPGCRCEGCVSTALRPWRITSTDGKEISLSKKATLRGANKAEESLVAADLARATRMLADKVDCPVSAINLRKLEHPDSDGNEAWVPVVDPDALDPERAPRDPVRSGELLALDDSSNKWRNVFLLQPYMLPEEHKKLKLRQRKVHGTVRMTLGGGQRVELPVTIHRMLPEDADILEAQLVVRRIGRHFRMHICVTIEIPDTIPDKVGPRVALHIGWRQTEDGDIRVATWGSSAPIAVPPWLTSVHVAPGVVRSLVTRNQSGQSGEVLYPKEWLDLAGRIASLHSIRSRHFDDALKKTGDWLEDAGPLEAYRSRPEITATGLRQWRSIGRLLDLTEELEETWPDAGILPTLREWRDGTADGTFHGDLHLYDFAAHEEEQLLGRRDYTYHVIAAWLARTAREVVVDDMNLAALRQGPGEDATPDELAPAQVVKKSRSNAKAASSGALRALLVTAAKRDGLPVATLNVSGFGRTCPSCQHVAPKDDPRWSASAQVVCDGCGRSYDQDRATVRMMLLDEQNRVGETK
jgi:hypothetical protein